MINDAGLHSGLGYPSACPDYFARLLWGLSVPGVSADIPNLKRTRAFDVATDDPIMASVAGRYASALFDLAVEQGKAADVEQDLTSFQALIDESADLRRLVKSPAFTGGDQVKAISAIVDRAGLSTISANFLRVIARNRRLYVVSDMIRAYRQLAARARGEIDAEVVSAAPLTEAQVVQLSDTLKAAVGKDVRIQTRVDSALLGGLVVKVGSRMIDSSLKTKLNSLKTRMKEVR